MTGSSRKFLTERKIGKNLKMGRIERIASRAQRVNIFSIGSGFSRCSKSTTARLSAERQKLKIKPMTLAHLELAGADKLVTLRRLDQFREWQSLDEKRYCLVCGHLITGWEILVVANSSDPHSQVFTYTATGFWPDCMPSSHCDVRVR